MTSRPDFIKRFGQEPFVEIGVFEGEFSKQILQAGLKDVTLVDPWFTGTTIFSGDKDGRDCRTVDADETYVRVVREIGAQCKVLRMTSSQFWSITSDASLGSVYIDGDHTLEAVRLDLREALRCVRPGGYIMGHDYTMPPGMASGVKQAVDELGYPCEITTLDGRSSFAFRRPKRLVYTVACHDRDFASLIEFFPVRDALVICDPVTADLIPEPFTKHILPELCTSPENASTQKLRIFEFAPGYDEYMYLDLDIIGRVDNGRRWVTDPDKLHVLYEVPFSDVEGHKDRASDYLNPKTFNAGQFTFGPEIQKDFELVLTQCLERPGDSYYEQGFMNHHFRECASFPFEVALGEWNCKPSTELLHFIKPNKRERIIKFKKGMGQRKVLIGTPSYDGTLDVWYVNSLVNTVRESEDRGIRIDPIYMSFDALVQRARNDLVDLAIEGGYDELIFIDSDIEWDPSWIFQLLKYKHDVVGGTYRKKTDDYEGYVMKADEGPRVIDTRTGLVKVAGLGTGFMKLSRKALEYLWNGAEPYVDHKDKNSRMVFDIAIQNGVMVSEDILMCQKLTRGGFDIWLDPRMCCNHTGPKKFTGNFINWLERLETKEETPVKE